MVNYEEFVETFPARAGFLARETGNDDDDDPDGDDNVPEDFDWNELASLLGGQREERHRKTGEALLRYADCLSFKVRRTSRVVTRLFDGMLRDPEPDEFLRSTQLAVLGAIRESNGREPMKEIARRLFMDPSTLSYAVKRLEDRGLVVRAPLPSDRRCHTVRITDLGWTTIQRNLRGWVAAQRELVRRLPASRLDDTYRGIFFAFDAARRGLYHRGLRWEMHYSRHGP